jgi:hypothetical protein
MKRTPLSAFALLLLAACSGKTEATPQNDAAPTDGDVAETPGETGPSGPRTQYYSPIVAAAKVDLLLMIDNSASMADKFTELSKRMPELIKALVDPELDPVTGQPKTAAAKDLHVGVITSSLGSHGTSACDPATYGSHVDDRGHLLPRATENGTQGYTVDAVGGPLTPVACPAPIASSALTWAYDPAASARYTGKTQVKDTEAAVSCVVQSAKEDGCGYEAQLESIYHFLIDPAPYLTADVVPACTKGVSGDACGTGQITPTGVDSELLTERAAFLRPDSLLAVLMLSDEDDGSINPTSLNWLPLAYSKGTMPKGWKACESMPDDVEPETTAEYDAMHASYGCWSCVQSVKDAAGNVITDPGGNCGTNWATSPLNADVDGRNSRLLQQTRRFGYNFLFGRKRYVDGFSATMVPGSDGKLAPNPIFAGGLRTKDLVLVGGFLGVPKRLIPSGGKLAEADWDKIVSPDRSKRDPHMIAQIAPRTGVPKFAGDRAIDQVNGGDRDIPDGDDLQYACIQARYGATTPSRDCDAAGSGAKNPVCGPDSGGKGTQPYFKAYPTLRELRVLHELSKQDVPVAVASICDDSYAPQLLSVVSRLQTTLKSGAVVCAEAAPTSQGGATSCAIFEVLAPAAGATTSCESLPGYCTPGAASCRVAAGAFPPSSTAVAAAGLVVRTTVGSSKEQVPAALSSDGNVYATGSDGRKHLVCEVTALTGNPAIASDAQTKCAHDVGFASTPAGWCFTDDATLTGACGHGAYRMLGGAPKSGSDLTIVCR